MAINKKLLCLIAGLVSLSGCTNPSVCQLPEPPADVMQPREPVSFLDRMELMLAPYTITEATPSK